MASRRDFGLLMNAVHQEDVDEVRNILREKVFTQDLLNDQLVDAAGNGSDEIVELLLTAGANDYLNSAIVSAATGKINILPWMLDQLGSQINSDDYVKMFVGAAINNHLDVLEFLLDSDPFGERSVSDQYLNQGLIVAAYAGHEEIINFLIDNGAHELGMALISAKEAQNTNIVRMLQKLGAKPYSEDRETVIDILNFYDMI